jgi:hypothetical protein
MPFSVVKTSLVKTGAYPAERRFFVTVVVDLPFG